MNKTFSPCSKRESREAQKGIAERYTLMLILVAVIRTVNITEVVEGDGGQNREGERFAYQWKS